MDTSFVNQIDMQYIMVQLEYLFRIILACFLGLLIGNERKNRNKSAGVRTHAIVALGSALIMVVSKYGFADIPDYDAARVAAQVVSGIGFLGAGVIFVRNNLVNGLTTAAGIWATAGVGLALGAGLYIIGISCAVLIIVMQMLMHSISYFAKVPSLGLLKLTIVQRPGAIKEMEKFLSDEKVDVASVKVHKNKKEEIKLEFEVVYPPGFDRVKLLAKLAEEDCVVTISE